jgi:xanthine dehydrogenase molybdopterin-binding subunit B
MPNPFLLTYTLKSLHPSTPMIDMGQSQGAFVMGLGHYQQEKHSYLQSIPNISIIYPFTYTLKSLHPSTPTTDMGQSQGAFVMGLGHYLQENHSYLQSIPNIFINYPFTNP